MSLQPGYNIVTERIAETNTDYTALEFFRALADDEQISTPVTVTELDRLLYHASEADRDEIVVMLRDILRQTSSLGAMDAVQFLLEGSLVDDVKLRVRIERTDGATYLDIGELFVESPKMVGANHAIARK